MRFVVLLALAFPLSIFSQRLNEYIQKNAIEIQSIETLSTVTYDAVKDYEVIMIGENHGTKEPAAFTLGLAESIIKNEKSVAIGLEIPRNQMIEFIQSPSRETLSKTQYFSQENKDGRKSKAWLELILACIKNENINLFFIDNFTEQGAAVRDLSMYETVRDYHKNNPEEKIITLTGDMHISLVPIYSIDRMGTLLKNDEENFNSDKICSVKHIFTKGTAYSNKGNGLEIQNYDLGENVYSTAVDYKNYILMYESAEPSSNNCLFYTRKVTHSFGIH